MVPRGSAAAARRRRQAREGPVTERGARPAAAAVAAATEEGPKGSSRRSWEAGPAGWIPGQRLHPSCSGEPGSGADMEHRERTRGAGLERGREGKARAPGRPPSGETPLPRRLQLRPAMESERGRPGCAEGKERGRDARRERGAGPHAKKAAALSHSLRAAEARAGPGQGKGSRGLSPASPGRPWRPRPLHRPAGAATARAAGPRSLQQPRPPRAEPETLLLLPLLLLLLPAAHSRRSPALPLTGAEPSPGGARRAGPSAAAAAARRRLGAKWRRREPEPTHGPGGRRGRAAGHAPPEPGPRTVPSPRRPGEVAAPAARGAPWEL
ncbi:skin secretory protein xP2-like [Prinia subflava]|uniref:skin secretory protein xP2-like n=1 Tax=Prinia subflava TaxID=208062 RepID=UPI002FE21979